MQELVIPTNTISPLLLKNIRFGREYLRQSKSLRLLLTNQGYHRLLEPLLNGETIRLSKDIHFRKNIDDSTPSFEQFLQGFSVLFTTSGATERTPEIEKMEKQDSEYASMNDIVLAAGFEVLVRSVPDTAPEKKFAQNIQKFFSTVEETPFKRWLQ